MKDFISMKIDDKIIKIGLENEKLRTEFSTALMVPHEYFGNNKIYQSMKLPNRCQSKEDGICRLPLNSCTQCAKAPKFSEWHQQKLNENNILHVSQFYDALADKIKHRLDQLIETYITEIILKQVPRKNKNSKSA